MPSPQISLITKRLRHSSSGCLKKRGPTSKLAPALTCGQVLTGSVAGQSHWLDDYALFRALRNKFDGAPYLNWPAQLVDREPTLATRPRTERIVRSDRPGGFVQFLLSRQAERVKA